MDRRSIRKGVTLLELVLAVSLAAGMTGAALLFYDQALSVRGAVGEDVGEACAMRAVMDQLTRELRSASPLDASAGGLEGDDGEMRLIVADIPGPAAWAVRTIREDPIPPEQDLRRVSYSIRTVETESGEVLPVGLERRTQKLLTALEASEGKQIVSRLVSDDIRFLRFRYFASGQWVRQWSGGLPEAVEITLARRPPTEDSEPTETAYEAHRRVVYIPQASIRTETPAQSVAREDAR